MGSGGGEGGPLCGGSVARVWGWVVRCHRLGMVCVGCGF